jgi:hypothetical protein
MSCPRFLLPFSVLHFRWERPRCSPTLTLSPRAVPSILRKGTSTEQFSAELQATYPINRWYPGVSGYLTLQAFTGYGEYLLDYNEREPWSVRIGYAISR